jgi:hypothetical protein
MTPRVVPRSSDGEAVQRIVEAEARERRREDADRPYRPGSRHSYFRDRWRAAASEERARKALESPVLRGHDGGDPERPETDAELAEAQGGEGA